MKLETLIDQTLGIIKARGYTEKTWKFAFRNGRFSSLRQYFENMGTADFSIEITHEYMYAIQQRHENGELSYSRYMHLKKLTAWLIEVYETGELIWKPQPSRKIHLNIYLHGIFAKYIEFIRGVLSSKNVEMQKSVILQFLEFLQHEKGYNNFLSLSLKDIQDFILFIRKRRKRMDSVIHAVKRFVSYLRETSIICEDLTPALCMQAQRTTRILKGFTHEEVDMILDQPDRNTPIGKRNYAIMLLGKNTGLRIGDIINLKLADINWQNDELFITQKKTGNQLILPLNLETKNAIIDYIHDSRPKCDLPYIFLRHHAPYDALSQQSVTVFFTKYRTSAEIPTTPNDGKSFHGLRRSIATWMLEAEIPLTTISQILGHRDLDSAVPYLSFDENKLRLCSFSLHGIEVKKEGLM